MATPKPLASVSRALQIIEFLAQSDVEGLSLSTISKVLQLNKATVYNTLATLREHKWVEQDEKTGYYRLGEGIRPLASYQTSTQRIVDALHPALVAISRRFNELVHLGRLTGTRIIYLDKVEPDRSIRVISKIGREAVAARTGLGRALIGSLPEQERDIDWFMDDPELQQEHPPVREQLRKSLTENIKSLSIRGWTQEVEENEQGISCVAVPVTLVGGRTIAISVTTPIERMPASKRAEFAAGIAEELAKLSNSVDLALPQALAR